MPGLRLEAEANRRSPDTKFDLEELK